MACDIVPYRADLKDQVIDLAAWEGSVHEKRAYFEWKHERNPYSSTPLLYLALDRGRVVGMRSFFGVRWECGPDRRVVDGLYADDAAIAPAYRNLGVLRRIMDVACDAMTRRGYEYLFSLSAGPVMQVASLAAGWRSVGSMQPARWDPGESTNPFLRRLNALARRIGYPMATVRRRRSPAPDRWRAADRPGGSHPVSMALEPRIDHMSALVERVADGRIRHVRDRAYFAWRLQNPASRYSYLFCGEGDLHGYLILRENALNAGDATLSVVDWEGTTDIVLRRLMEGACRLARGRGLLTWRATLSAEKLAVLADQGFRSEPQTKSQSFRQPALLVKALASDRPSSEWTIGERQLLQSADWDLRLLYSMSG